MAKRVREVMTSDPVTLSSDSTLSEAAREMREADIGSVIVLDDGSICGIVTDRDIVVRGIAQGLDPEETPLSEVCSRELVTLSPDEEVDQAVTLMRERGIRRLLVEEAGRPVGIVSLGDLAIERDKRSVLGQISAQPASR
jgi:CBS domain-containing protein